MDIEFKVTLTLMGQEETLPRRNYSALPLTSKRGFRQSITM